MDLLLQMYKPEEFIFNHTSKFLREFLLSERKEERIQEVSQAGFKYAFPTCTNRYAKT